MTDIVIPPDIIGAALGAIAGGDTISATTGVSHHWCDRIIELREIKTAWIAVSIWRESVEGKVSGGLGEFARS